MTDTNDDLRKRILADEPLDGDEVDRLKARLTRKFDRQQKKLIVQVTFWLLVFLVGMGWSVAQFTTASGVKMMLFSIMVLLVAYESTVLIKLWYAIALYHSQIMQAIKNLQLRLLAGTTAETANATAPLPQGETDKRKWGDRISVKAMRRISFVVLIAVGMYGGLQYAEPALMAARRSEHPYRVTCEGKKVFEEHIAIALDGTCRLNSRQSHIYAGVAPQETIEIQSDNAWTEAVWRDAQGNVLPHEVRQDKDGYHYTVHLARPIFRGELIDVRFSGETAGWAKEENGTWVLTNRRTWGKERVDALTINDYQWPREVKITETVKLPPGAELDSRTPETMRWKDHDGCWVLCYQEQKKAGELEELRITYRLPSAATSQAH